MRILYKVKTFIEGTDTVNLNPKDFIKCSSLDEVKKKIAQSILPYELLNKLSSDYELRMLDSYIMLPNDFIVEWRTLRNTL